MTISMDGKYYRRGDSQKRPVRILCVDASGSWPVLYLREGGVLAYATIDGAGHMCKGENAYDLLPIPVPPKLVPLEKPDVIIGTTLIRKRNWQDGTECLVLWAAFNSLGILLCDVPKQVHWKELQDSYDYSNDHGTTWQPCSKAAP